MVCGYGRQSAGDFRFNTQFCLGLGDGIGVFHHRSAGDIRLLLYFQQGEFQDAFAYRMDFRHCFLDDDGIDCGDFSVPAYAGQLVEIG